MLGLIARRLLQLPLILLVIYSITLALAWAVPGSPLERPEGRRPPAEVVEAMQRQYRLDSFWSFYCSYLESATGIKYVRGAAEPGAAVFDLGPSLQYRDQRVASIIGASLPVSAVVGATAIAFALAIGVPLGLLGGARPGTAWDSGSLLLSLIGISLPSFVIGTGLLLLFSLVWRLFPVGSWNPPASLVLPALTLSLPYAAYIARLTRLGVIDAMRSDYVRTARAKGLSEWQVLTRHAMKNAFLPVLSYLGPAAAGAMTGSFVVEVVFSVPGLGQHFVNAVQNKDLFLIIGIVLVFSTMLVMFNLIVDVLYRWVDPRIA